uniref:Uncharacterized protein n=1 Tax=Gadus morhua TaxID=8049 RepID=A0A8C5B871_GADMO
VVSAAWERTLRMNVSGVLIGLLLSVASCSANNGARAPVTKTRTLQPWLVGLAAVAGFLFIVFIMLIAKRLMKKNRSVKSFKKAKHSNKCSNVFYLCVPKGSLEDKQRLR